MMQNIQHMNAKLLESGKLRLQGFYREIPVTHNFMRGRNAPKTTSGGSQCKLVDSRLKSSTFLKPLSHISRFPAVQGKPALSKLTMLISL